jgi:Rrf2 family protein
LPVWRKSRVAIRAAAELAERTRLSRPTVSKVLKDLQRAGMVISSRGAQGGYRLARARELITAAQILDVFEGPIAITECSGASSQCGIEKLCRSAAHGSESTPPSAARSTM